MRCPNSFDVRVRTRNRFRSIVEIGNAINVCEKCQHEYYVTTFLGNCNRSIHCPCCRKTKPKLPTHTPPEDAPPDLFTPIEKKAAPKAKKRRLAKAKK